jgi:periplasmic protein TonB
MASIVDLDSTRRDANVRDPLAKVLSLGRRELPLGVTIGLLGAILLHSPAVYAITISLVHLADFSRDVQSEVLARLRGTYDVDTTPPPPPPPEPPPEETPVEKQPVVPTSTKTEAPPAAAEAGKVLTQEPDPNEPVDLTGNTFVSGDSDRFAGGTTAVTGTSKTAVRERNTKPGGVPGAKGVKPGGGPPAAPKQDQGRAAVPTSRNWNCGFPPEADFDQIDFATVMLTVTVGADGRAKTVTVLSDPGHGFGRLARSCAQRMQYTPGLDKDGNPVAKTTAPFPVRFTR